MIRRRPPAVQSVDPGPGWQSLPLPALVLDIANRPQPALQSLTRSLDAPYLPLPRADAHRLSSVLQSALGA